MKKVIFGLALIFLLIASYGIAQTKKELEENKWAEDPACYKLGYDLIYCNIMTVAGRNCKSKGVPIKCLGTNQYEMGCSAGEAAARRDLRR